MSNVDRSCSSSSGAGGTSRTTSRSRSSSPPSSQPAALELQQGSTTGSNDDAGGSPRNADEQASSGGSRCAAASDRELSQDEDQEETYFAASTHEMAEEVAAVAEARSQASSKTAQPEEAHDGDEERRFEVMQVSTAQELLFHKRSILKKIILLKRRIEAVKTKQQDEVGSPVYHMSGGSDFDVSLESLQRRAAAEEMQALEGVTTAYGWQQTPPAAGAGAGNVAGMALPEQQPHQPEQLQQQLQRCERNERGSSSSSSSAKPTVIRRRMTQPKKVSAKLDAIEEGDIDESFSRSDRESDSETDEMGEIEDHADLDESVIVNWVVRENLEAKKEIQRLRDEAVQHKKIAEDLATETVANEAHYESKISRLMQQLDMEYKSHTVTRDKLATSDKSGTSDGRSSQLELSKLLEAAQVRNATLQEGKRIAEARVEDLKRAVALEQQKHKQAAEELMQRMPSTGANTGAQELSELVDLRSRLKSIEEDKNVLINTFEGKEVHWKTQIETSQLEMDEMRRKHECEIQRLESMISGQEGQESAIDFPKDVKEAKDSTPRDQADSKPKPTIVYTTSSSSGSNDMALTKRSRSIFRWFQCPERGKGGGPRPAFCQEFCWKVLTAVSGKLVLWCSTRDYTILEASREATVVWGASLLHGKTIFSLASGPSSGAWLRKAFHCHQRMAEMEMGRDRNHPAFVVRGLGCEAFVSKTGESFDSSVVTAYFPAEVACNRPAALLVVIDPLKTANGNLPKSSMKPQGSKVSSSGRHSRHGSQGRRLQQISSPSEVSHSSVTPSDSASNVHGLGF